MTIAYDVPPAAPVGHHCDNGDRTCFPHDRVGQSDGRGSGRIAQAPAGQCGRVDEDPQDCSREGRQNGPAGGWIEFRSYDAQYSIGGTVGYIANMAVAAGPGEVWRAEALALMAMPEGAKLLGWWPTAINQGVLAGPIHWGWHCWPRYCKLNYGQR